MTARFPFGEPAAGLTERQRRADRFARRLVIPLAIVLTALVLVFFVFFDFSRVDGPSMEPTLRNAEYVLLTKGLAVPRRGDVVVLRVIDRGRPREWIKRIVATAGDTVRFDGDTVLVNGAQESFAHGTIVKDARPAGQLVVPPGMLFVMGDNRPVSFDSRFVGPIAASAVHGRVVAVYAPVSRIRRVPGP